MQNIFAVENDIGCQQRRKKPKIRVAENCEPQDTILANQAYLLPKIAERIGLKLLRRIGGTEPS